MSGERGSARPVRTCVGCGERDVQSGLLRLQIRGTGVLTVVERPHAGRSAYVHDTTSCIASVVKSRILRRSLRVDVPRSTRVEAVANLTMRVSLPGEPEARR